ncbi:MAG: mercury(II) reductase [Dehalococcoidia bacterium]|nr:mercury(II) reductase [Dehalococcoidia bacterium]
MNDLIIIGGGAAAFSAATKANDLGATALMINAGLPLGGTCVNVGCIPSKHLLGIAEALTATRHSVFDSVRPLSPNGAFSVKAARQEKDALVAGLRHRNYEEVLRSLDQVDFREGRGRIVAPGKVDVGGEVIEGRHILVATGSRASIPPIPGLAEAGYLTNVEALQLDEAPGKLVVIGGGPLGLEFAQVFARFGSQVTVLEALPQIVPKAEPEIASVLQEALEAEGIEIRTGMRIERVEPGPSKTIVCGPEASDCFEADAILVATGIRANTEEVGPENAGGRVTRAGFVETTNWYEAGQGLWAAGDVTGRMPLETVAAKEGALAAANALEGRRESLNYDAVPWAVFTSPQLAGVGLTESESMTRTGYCNCRTVYYTQVPKAMAVKDTQGAVKLTVDRDNRIRGAYACGTNAAEIIHEAALAVRHGLSIYDIIDTVHVFPTYSEAIKLAAQAFTRDVSVMTCCIG